LQTAGALIVFLLFSGPQYVGWWHLPAQFFPLATNDPYQDAELFGVIRDPYDRMVSEFYYICTLKVFDWRPDQCDRSRLSDASYMNKWLTRKIQNRARDSGLSFLVDNGHFTPQYDFVVGPHQVRMLDYVLKLDEETLADDFHKLMTAFGLSKVQLQKLNALGAAARGDSSTHLNVEHLDATSLAVINELYSLDFSLGDYKIRTESGRRDSVIG
jgi:Sulfotransferase family